MKILSTRSSIRTIKPGHPAFLIKDGLIVSPRAGFEIDQHCPKEYKQIIQQALSYGWLKPVANLTERELIISGLLKE